MEDEVIDIFLKHYFTNGYVSKMRITLNHNDVVHITQECIHYRIFYCVLGKLPPGKFPSIKLPPGEFHSVNPHPENPHVKNSHSCFYSECFNL